MFIFIFFYSVETEVEVFKRLAMLTQLINGRAGIHTRAAWLVAVSPHCPRGTETSQETRADLFDRRSVPGLWGPSLGPLSEEVSVVQLSTLRHPVPALGGLWHVGPFSRFCAFVHPERVARKQAETVSHPTFFTLCRASLLVMGLKLGVLGDSSHVVQTRL